MKRHLSSLAIATIVLSSSVFTPIALNEVHAAGIQQTVSVEKIYFNGLPKAVPYYIINKHKLYSAQDLSKLLSATYTYNAKTKAYTFSRINGKQKQTLVLKAYSTYSYVNGKKVKLTTSPKNKGSKLYVDINPFIKSLGGNILVDGNLLISTNGVFTFSSLKLTVDGQLKSIRSLSMGGKQLISADDLAKTYSAYVKIDKNKQVTIVKSGKVSKVGGYPIKVKGLLYADLNELIKALGGEVVSLPSGKFIATTGLISGDSYNPQWIDNSTLMIQNDSASGEGTYVVNVASKKAALKINGSDVVVSPNGKQAIYSDESGTVYLVDILKKKVTALNNSDDSSKLDLIWSKDGGKVYFITGSKNEKISSINISNGLISDIFSDTLTSKSDLQLSPDGKKILYTVGKEGTTTYTDPDKTDVSNIDLTDTESQLYLLDLTAATPSPVKLTNSSENKAFSYFLNTGNIIYTSYFSDENTLPILNMIDSHNTIKSLVTNKDIVSVMVSRQGKVYFISNEDGLSVIYSVDTANRKLTKVAQTKLTIYSLTTSPDGKSIIATAHMENADQVFVLKNGQFEMITK
jgi:Tol biopolymer transport system component